jgi:hypothetical protein
MFTYECSKVLSISCFFSYLLRLVFFLLLKTGIDLLVFYFVYFVTSYCYFYLFVFVYICAGMCIMDSQSRHWPKETVDASERSMVEAVSLGRESADPSNLMGGVGVRGGGRGAMMPDLVADLLQDRRANATMLWMTMEQVKARNLDT